LTALEAAKSKTLAITNNLGALEDTVGDRGLLISEELLENFREIVNSKRIELVKKNYEWANLYSWKQTANLLF
jgi:hypothetical protein